ncbi:hypothetical protein ACF8LD_04875 [Pseudomonas sp. zbq_5]|uniref:hypothetical protein n=1 Tax=unclassified Pseudomonas TaxID=196821 RepID=UPI00370BD95B
MPKDIGHIKNPLTVIAIFAGIAETSGTIVLPLLDANVQGTFVWFLMLFPCLLIAMFFGVLYMKHHVLYAPSDFQEDKSFVDMHFTSRTKSSGQPFGFGMPDQQSQTEHGENSGDDLKVSQQVKGDSRKTEGEIKAAPETHTDSQNANQDELAASYSGRGNKQSHQSSESVGREPVEIQKFMTGFNKFSLREIRNRSRQRVIRNLARNIQGVFRVDVEAKQLPNVTFDAVVESEDRISVVSFVEVSSDDPVCSERISKSLSQAQIFWDTLSDNDKSRFVFHLALMYGPDATAFNDTPLIDLTASRLLMPFKTEVFLYEYDRNYLGTYDLSA